MPLHLAEHIVVIDLLQIIGEPFIFAGQKAEEGRFTGSLTAYQTEHQFKLTSRFEYPVNGSQQKQTHDFGAIRTDFCAQEVMKHIGDTLGAVPHQMVQVFTDRVILVLVSHHRQRSADAVFVVQPISFFQIQHEIIEIRVTHGRGGAFPPQGLADVNAPGEDVVADGSMQHRIGHKDLIHILHGVFHLPFVIHLQKFPDFLRVLAESVLSQHCQIFPQFRCQAQIIAVQVLSLPFRNL